MGSESGMTELNRPKVSLYVGNLDPDVDQLTLIETFSKVGPLSYVHISRDKVTNMSLGYGFVKFENPNDAETALRTLHFQTLNRKPMRIMCRSDPSVRKSGVGNIFIRNIDKRADHKDLYDAFRRFGYILSYMIAKDEAGNSKGYGFVNYETEESASQAINQINNTSIHGQQVFVTKHIPREDREKKDKLCIEKVLPKNNPFEAKKKVQDLINLLKTELQCSICCELFKEACITDCGHIFCDKCIVEWKNHNNTCPTCRANLMKPEKKVFEINNFIVKVTALLLSGNDQS